jgi:hypothetical protein
MGVVVAGFRIGYERLRLWGRFGRLGVRLRARLAGRSLEQQLGRV